MTDRLRNDADVHARWLAALRDAQRRALEEAAREQATAEQARQLRVKDAPAPDRFSRAGAPGVDLGSVDGASSPDPVRAREVALDTLAHVLGRSVTTVERCFPPEALALLSEDVQGLLQGGATAAQARAALVDVLGQNPQAVQGMAVSLYQGAFTQPPPAFVLEQAQVWAELIDQRLGGTAQEIAQYLDFQLGRGTTVPERVAQQEGALLPSTQVAWVDASVEANTVHAGEGQVATGGVPFFSQLDERWKSVTMNEAEDPSGPYGLQVLQSAGCALTSAAMALSAATGRSLTPELLDSLHPYGVDAEGRPTHGLDWSALGMAEADGSLDTLVQELEAGRPVVVGVDSDLSDFRGSDDGRTNHWVVLTGVQRDGAGNVVGFTANDPAQVSGGQMAFAVQGDALVGRSGSATYTTTGKFRVLTGAALRLADGETVTPLGVGRPLASTVSADAGAPRTRSAGVGEAFEDVSREYPGDHAPQAAIAAWMGKLAYEAGLPPELPVMCGLVESGMRNLGGGDADSRGYFQMRTSIWDKGEYRGYGEDPQKQMQWFIDTALRVKADHGYQNSDAASFGEWCANIERPAERFRGRYATRLAEARQLLAGAIGLEPNVWGPSPEPSRTLVASGRGGGSSVGGGAPTGGGRPQTPSAAVPSAFESASPPPAPPVALPDAFFATLMRSLLEFSLWLKEEEGRTLAEALADNPDFQAFVKEKTGKSLGPNDVPSPELVLEFIGRTLAPVDLAGAGISPEQLATALQAGQGWPELSGLAELLDARLGLGLESKTSAIS